MATTRVEMGPEFSGIVTVGLIILILANCLLVYYLYSNYDSIFGVKNESFGPLSYPINTVNSSLSVDSLLSEYQKNATSASANYTDKAAYVNGYVTNLFEPKPGTYESCYYPDFFTSYSCANSNVTSGFVVWYWNGEANADHVVSGTTVTVECYISGYLGGNLTLSLCSFPD
jgi:tRNA_anti-like